MQQFCPDIPFVTEYLLADRWYKGLDDQPTDESGRVGPGFGQPTAGVLFAASLTHYCLVLCVLIFLVGLGTSSLGAQGPR